MKRILFVCLFLSSILWSYAGKISGSVSDSQGNLLSYASITVKGTSKGTIANSQGKYMLNLAPGQYTLVCQYIGYKTEEKKIVVSAEEIIVDFRLSIQELAMPEVVIKRGEDPAVEIIRQAIKKRTFYDKQVDSFSVDVYIKGLLRSRAIPDKFLGKKIDKTSLAEQGIDSTGKGILFLSESLTKVSYQQPDKIKYEVLSSRESGGGYGLSFPFFINFYQNNVSVFSNNLNPRGFISPISDNAFHYYQFRYEGNFFEDGKMVDKIKVTPKRKNEPLFWGYMQIIDGEWRIHSLQLTTSSLYQLELIDTLEIKQLHTSIKGDIWRTQNQVVYVAVKKFGFDMTGNFLNIYNNYNLAPAFHKNYFNRVVMSYDTAFNKKDSIYWSTVRPVPLAADEKRDFVFKDSMTKASTDSMYSKTNIDSLRKKQKPPKVQNFFIGGVNRNFYSPSSFTGYRLEPLLKELEYNTVEGLAISVEQSLTIRPRKGTNNFSLDWSTRYGISNAHLNSFLSLGIKPKGDNFRNRYLQLEGGKRLLQFNRENPIDAFTNSLYTLLGKKNYMKLYEAWFGSMEYNNRWENGLRWNISARFEDRIPLKNSTDYSFFKKQDTILPNHPYELADIPFNNHQALVASLRLSYQPGQRYVQFPGNKVSIGSRYPTFQLEYSKGLQALGSDVDFDKWRFSVFDDLNLRLGGLFRYRISAGGFLNHSKVEIPDYQHFNGNQTFYNFKYLNSFQLAPYYRYSNIEDIYGVAHVEHHFNGLLTNKIPLFNKLKWNLVLGSNAFYVNDENYYVETFAGFENIFKIFRVDFVTAYQTEPGNRFGVRIGLGGIIGSAVQLNGR